jgi:ABC-type transporter Mla subunit MlaD
MLTGEQLAGLIVAMFWAILVSFLAYVLLKLARLLKEATEAVAELGDRTAPLLDDMAATVARANEQLDRVDLITKNMGSVSQNAAAVSTTVTSIVGGPLVKAAAFSYGVRKAIGSRGHGGQDGKR